MTKRKVPRLIEDIELEYAAHPPKRPVKGDEFSGNELRLLSAARPVPVREPVTVPAMVNGRELVSWERELFVERTERERARELALFDGLIG